MWLRNTNEVYLSICLFGKYQRTSLAEPVFPCLFMEKFKFDKVFYSAVDPAEVSDFLEGIYFLVVYLYMYFYFLRNE